MAFQIWGYVPDSDRAAAWGTVQTHHELLTGVSMFQYHLEANGDLAEYTGLGREPEWTRQVALPVTPMVTNLVEGRWDRDLVAGLLAQPDGRRHHIDQLVDLVVQGGYPALELDYESLTPVDRPLLTGFLSELGTALHQQGRQLSLALHAKTSEPGESPGAQAQDWAAIGAVADRIVIMTYDEDPSRPGPIASVSWAWAVLGFALSQIPADRVLQGIPFYGYEWADDGRIEYRTHREALDLALAHNAAPQREPNHGYIVVKYMQAGVVRQIWVPDAQTVESLLGIGRELGVAGYAIWRMGGEDPAVWDMIARGRA